MKPTSLFSRARELFHLQLLNSVLTVDDRGMPSNADRGSKASREIAYGIACKIGLSKEGTRLAGQSSGRKFETICHSYIADTFLLLKHLRPGDWSVDSLGSHDRLTIASFDQYSHLIALNNAARSNPELAAALGSDYTITPDIIISRGKEEDDSINAEKHLVGNNCSLMASIRKSNGGPLRILHASISCKWTIRSDRSQNSRAEALNLIRNRKGRLPHIMVVTGEPLPARIASIALGTGDIDCTYHFALIELAETLEELKYDDAREMLEIMMKGKRLRDISDLPLDLAI